MRDKILTFNETFHLHLRYRSMEKICKHCNQIFDAEPREINRGNAKFCSLSCASKNRNLNKKKYNISCIICNNSFISVNPKAKYCCNACKLRAYRKKMKSNFQISRKEYNILISQPCAICNWNKTSCDVHHIIPVYMGGLNESHNLITLCPNCHRMAHRNLISQAELQELRKSWTISSLKLSA